MDPHSDPHDDQAVRFARRLANLLEVAMKQQQYSQLTLVAPPHFLGLLRSSISTDVRKRLAASSRKDLTRLGDHALLRHLQNIEV
jgi:protein required for attachment to host cells